MKTWKKGESTDADLIDEMLKSVPDEELGLDSRRRGKSTPRKIEAKPEPIVKPEPIPQETGNHHAKLAQVTK